MSDDRIPEDHARELADCFAACAAGLFGYACVLTRGDRALAEDLVQVTFIAAAGQWPRVRCLCPAQRASWLRTTAGNLAVARSAAIRPSVTACRSWRHGTGPRQRTLMRKPCRLSRWSGGGR